VLMVSLRDWGIKSFLSKKIRDKKSWTNRFCQKAVRKLETSQKHIFAMIHKFVFSISLFYQFFIPDSNSVSNSSLKQSNMIFATKKKQSNMRASFVL
jgi:hypothetical protein